VASNEGGGVTGTKSLGVRELTYRLSFLASSVMVRAPCCHPSSVL
jgi:hypothetical protein